MFLITLTSMQKLTKENTIISSGNASTRKFTSPLTSYCCVVTVIYKTITVNEAAKLKL